MSEPVGDGAPTVLNDRYELQRRVGRGGMAEVHLARDQLLTRPVAVKALFPQFATDPSFVARFRREAQAAANLNHPNIVGVYDWGRQGDIYYIVMEYVESRTLARIIRDEGALDAGRAAMVAAEVAAALGFAHRSGVVHRDVKPGNVLITEDGKVKVADFGIARAITSVSEEDLTQTGSVMGTAAYFSPEQAQGHAVDPRSDLYSLGIVMYEMVTGRPPFSGTSPVAIAYKHLQEVPVPVREVKPEVPAELEAVIMKLLEKEPADRYATADELRADLRRFTRGEPLDVGTAMVPVAAVGATVEAPPVPAAPTATVVSSTIDDRPEPPPEPVGPGRRTGWFLALLLVLLAVLAGLLVAFVRAIDDTGPVAQVTVPGVTGKTFDQAEQELVAAGLTVSRNDQPDAAPEREVLAQDPDAGDDVDENAEVTLTVSKGPIRLSELTDCPDAAAVQTELEALGFEQVDRRPELSDDCADGQVVGQEPGPGEYGPDRNIVLVVRSGPATPPDDTGSTTTTTTEPPAATTTTEPPATTTTTTEPSTTTTTTEPPTTSTTTTTTEPTTTSSSSTTSTSSTTSSTSSTTSTTVAP